MESGSFVINNDFAIIGLLVFLVILCFYLGYKYALDKALQITLTVLEEEKIIRLVEINGEIEVYSGSKIYNGDDK